MKTNYEVNTKCDKCNSQMYPIEMPKDTNEMLELMKTTYQYKKPSLMSKKMFCQSIKKGYIRFKCPNDIFEKMIQLQEILIQGFINANVCKDCPLEVCLWTKCNRGGYLK